MQLKRSVWLGLAAMLVITVGFGGLTRSDPAPRQGKQVAATSNANMSDGLEVRLSSGTPASAGPAKRSVAAGTPLDAAATAKLLARVPPLPADPAARQAFSFRSSSLPPPRAGVTVIDPFEPKVSTPPVVASGPLTVERHAPDGDVPIAPVVSVTFSQPMVALGSHAESIRNVPVEISPTQTGQWRWLGTRTLVFDPATRLPMATRYTVRVLPDAKSVTGQRLEQPFNFTFTTQAPRLIAKYPEADAQPLSPVILVVFDQRIDTARAVSSIALTADKRSVAVRAATEKEVQADETVAAAVKNAEASGYGGRYLALVPQQPLPKGTAVEVVVKKGLPSAEGPLTTEADQTFRFSTFAPLAIVEASCGYNGICPPGAPWNLRFNNPLDEETFDPKRIRVEPALPGAEVQAFGNQISVRGDSVGQTRYQVRLPATLRDRFGQTLQKEAQRTFDVSKAEPALLGPPLNLMVLDPAAKQRAFGVFSIGISEFVVRIRRVGPEDWNAYLAKQGNSEDSASLPGALVFDQVVPVVGPADRLSETQLDLSRALNSEGYGHALITVEPKTWPTKWKPRVTTWVQATAIGLDGFVDGDEFLAWTTNLADGKPLADVDLELLPHRARRPTDATGLARLPLATEPVRGTPHMLIARRGKDVAFLPESFYYDSSDMASGHWFRQLATTQLAWFVYDDRAIYRPGETVSLKGWLRLNDPGKRGDVAGLSARTSKLSWQAKDSQGNEIAKGTVPVNPFGGFHTSFKLPDTPNLGEASIELKATDASQLAGTEHYHSFRIEEFRRPEFEVNTRASGGPYLVGASADVTVKASYFSSGDLSAAPVEWNVTSQAAVFVPPNRSDYTFGRWKPWWLRGYDDYGTSETQQLTAATGPDGTHTLHLDFLAIKPAQATSVTATASVTDVNRQTWAASESLLVHPADVYVGLKRARYFVEKGQPIELDVLVVDHDGKAVPGRQVIVQAFRLQQQRKQGRFVETRQDLQECRIVSSAADQQCALPTAQGGVYRVEATVTDAADRPNQTSLDVWVTGGALPPARGVNQETVTLIPDKEVYAIGDTARLLVQAPFFPAEGLLTVRRSGVVSTQRFQVDGASTVVAVPIREGYTPNIWAQVDLVGSAPRAGDDGKPLANAPRRPAFAAGSLRLSVPPTDRTLKLEVVPGEKDVMPGAKTRVRVKVLDSAGRPQPNVEVALTVVDEAVLALTGYQTPDPIAAFYAERQPDTRDMHLREWLRLARPDLADARLGMLRKSAAAPERAFSRGALEEAVVTAQRREEPAIRVRSDFSALATFAPEQRTDASGMATLEFNVPDNLTRYRIMAVAADKERSFGSGEASLTARLPLMVRPSPPRFLNYGDRFELPVVLQNQTDQPMSVELALRADNAKLLGAAGQRVAVPARDRVEVRFPVAAEMAGTASFQVVAVAAGFTDAARVSLPVRTPATTEAFATYGEIDGGAIRQQVRVPSNVVPTYGGLQVTTSSTQLASLTDAFVYLQNYPYECAEQVSSRVLSVAALRDVLSQFKVSGLPSKDEIEKALARDVTRLAGLQNEDGGFAFWRRGDESWPYVSIHVSHALARAKVKGYDVPAELLESSKAYLENIEEHIPDRYPDDVKQVLISYSLWVRKLLNDDDVPKARKQLTAVGVDKLPIESLGWLLGVLAADSGSTTEVAAILRRLGNQVTETAAAAHWVNGYTDGDYLLLHSSRRADAIILESLLLARPSDSLIPKVVRGLLAQQQQGRWTNTQENVFVLLAMDAYFAKYEKATPNLVARAWLGNQLAEEARFAGRETKRQQVEIPMNQLGTPGTEQPLVVGTTGSGRLYYRVGFTYAPSNLTQQAADQGFAVERRYEAVDDPADVKRGDDGVWRIKAGARVRVHVSMVTDGRRYHVALVDPLAAGLEVLNPDLAVTEPVPSDPQDDDAARPFRWWFGPWYEHQNLRDDRTEAFASALTDGVYKYTYVARATTPGTFVVPPAKAEEMYTPETFGRSASDRVVIE